MSREGTLGPKRIFFDYTHLIEPDAVINLCRHRLALLLRGHTSVVLSSTQPRQLLASLPTELLLKGCHGDPLQLRARLNIHRVKPASSRPTDTCRESGIASGQVKLRMTNIRLKKACIYANINEW